MTGKKSKILAEGEVTGHAHRVSAEDAWVIGEDTDEVKTLSAPSGTEVTHEEHGTINLPADDYDVSQQREIDPDTEEARRVAD